MTVSITDKTIEIFIPTAEKKVDRKRLAPRPLDLNGKRVAFIDNSKLHASTILDRVTAVLSAKYKLAETVRLVKPSAAAPIPEKAMAGLTGKKCDAAVIALADWGSCTSWSIHDSTTLEAQGIPTVTFSTDAFETLARLTAKSKGFTSLPVIVFPHPIKPFSVTQVNSLVDNALDKIVSFLTASGEKVTAPEITAKETAREEDKIRLKDSVETINAYFLEKGWTDGLPVLPPTEDNVRAMLKSVPLKPQDVVARVAPQDADATVEKIAVNAVMAGCYPSDMPIIIAAVRAMAEPAFNLAGIQATTNPAAPLLIINGPIIRKTGLNYGLNVLGQGWRANATIGRAIRLILLNIGGGIPAVVDRSTQGQPGKYSFCIAENEEENPWEPLHVERGFPRDSSTVTVVPACGTINVNENSANANELLATIAGSMNIMGGNDYPFGHGEPLLVLSPEHATVLAQAGFTKKTIKDFLYEKTKVAHGTLSSAQRFFIQRYRSEEFPKATETTMIPLTQRPDDIIIVVAGGPGTHSTYIFSFGLAMSVTKAITV